MSVTQEGSLFILAHQDDEFACACHIKSELRVGNRTYCIYLTNGSADGSKTATRDRESRRALAKLGVRAEDIFFIGSENGIADGALYRMLPAAYELVLRRAGAIPDLRKLYIMCWEGGHHDHDAGHLIGLRLARRLGIAEGLRQFPIYNGKDLPWRLFRVLSPLAEQGAISRRRLTFAEAWQNIALCLGYPSQAKTWMGLLLPVAWHLLVRRVGTCQQVSLAAITQRPHGGRLLYERMFGISFEDFEIYSREFTTATLLEHPQ